MARRWERNDGLSRAGESGARPPAGAPTGLPARAWRDALRRTPGEYKADNLSDWAAALTYYGVLAIFPALLALVSILGLLGSASIRPLIDNLATLAPGSARDIITDALRQLEHNRGQALSALIIGTLAALWSASGYIAAFMRASNAVYDIGEGRPVWKTLPIRFGVTLVVLLLLAAIAVGVVFTGTLADRTGHLLGIGQSGVTAWNFAKWPVMVILFALIIALLYWAAPNVRRGFSWVTPGSLLAVLIWIVISTLFALYVGHFASYNKTYGSLAAVIIFLVWLWLSNIAILLGLEFNTELERGRAIESGHPPDLEPYVEPRDTRGL
ncbi:YihY/virulence factor BrkB family protein [Streptomyces polygonati]|uniref:YihY/virulence factor BrkB family protein n=1 Tax=Streptomyces polygonati TaxID=1617087 RepID=A0ABV8HIC4_9ACTN